MKDEQEDAGVAVAEEEAEQVSETTLATGWLNESISTLEATLAAALESLLRFCEAHGLKVRAADDAQRDHDHIALVILDEHGRRSSIDSPAWARLVAIAPTFSLAFATCDGETDTATISIAPPEEAETEASGGAEPPKRGRRTRRAVDG